MFRAAFRRLLALDDPPERTALAFAVGVFIAFSPFLGLHTLIATLIAFLIREIIPWWVVVPLVLREIVLAVCVLALRRGGFAPPEVTYIGKGATFVLMYAFPFLLLTQGGSDVAAVARPIGYAFTIWGAVLYVWSGVLYVVQARNALRGTAGH